MGSCHFFNLKDTKATSTESITSTLGSTLTKDHSNSAIYGMAYNSVTGVNVTGSYSLSSANSVIKAGAKSVTLKGYGDLKIQLYSSSGMLITEQAKNADKEGPTTTNTVTLDISRYPDSIVTNGYLKVTSTNKVFWRFNNSGHTPNANDYYILNPVDGTVYTKTITTGFTSLSVNYQ